MKIRINDLARVFFFQAEDGIRDGRVTGVQTCALPISRWRLGRRAQQPSKLRTLRSPDRAGRRAHLPRLPAWARQLRRSEERRVGKECRSRRAQDDSNKKAGA